MRTTRWSTSRCRTRFSPRGSAPSLGCRTIDPWLSCSRARPTPLAPANRGRAAFDFDAYYGTEAGPGQDPRDAADSLFYQRPDVRHRDGTLNRENPGRARQAADLQQPRRPRGTHASLHPPVVPTVSGAEGLSLIESGLQEVELAVLHAEFEKFSLLLPTG